MTSIFNKPGATAAEHGKQAHRAEQTNLARQRVVSGIRSTGNLHLGNYHGAIKNWLKLQHEYDCFFFAADWHALTTHYEETSGIAHNSFKLVTDLLAAGLDPKKCTIFVQSMVPEHAELHLLLSMITPLSWLERVPTYKDQQEQLKEKDLATYGFLGYPLLQTADVLIYKAEYVPVGEDQVAHIELSRQIARRFNYIYGRDAEFMRLVTTGLQKLGKKSAKLLQQYTQAYQQRGDQTALQQGKDLLSTAQQAHNLGLQEQEALHGSLLGTGKMILLEPEPLLTPTAKFPGLDGRKMSKSYNNTIGLTEAEPTIIKKVETMPTDPARIKRTDPGEPEKCPVWPLHKIYSNAEAQQWVLTGCRTAGIGCLDCKHQLLTGLLAEQRPIRARAQEYEKDPQLVRRVLLDGAAVAREQAQATLKEVRTAMGIEYGDSK